MLFLVYLSNFTLKGLIMWKNVTPVSILKNY